MHSSENYAVLISVCEPLNHIHQDTKSAVQVHMSIKKLPWDFYEESNSLVVFIGPLGTQKMLLTIL